MTFPPQMAEIAPMSLTDDVVTIGSWGVPTPQRVSHIQRTDISELLSYVSNSVKLLSV